MRFRTVLGFQAKPRFYTSKMLLICLWTVNIFSFFSFFGVFPSLRLVSFQYGRKALSAGFSSTVFFVMSFPGLSNHLMLLSAYSFSSNADFNIFISFFRPSPSASFSGRVTKVFVIV